MEKKVSDVHYIHILPCRPGRVCVEHQIMDIGHPYYRLNASVINTNCNNPKPGLPYTSNHE